MESSALQLRGIVVVGDGGSADWTMSRRGILSSLRMGELGARRAQALLRSPDIHHVAHLWPQYSTKESASKTYNSSITLS